MRNLYTTQERAGFGKHNYNHNEYRLDGDEVVKVRCNRSKFFDGDENNWEYSEKVQDRWATNDASMPEWLKKLL